MAHYMELWDAYDEKLNKIEGMTLVRGEEVRKHLGGMWEATAGGSALQGEDPITCALRELS